MFGIERKPSPAKIVKRVRKSSTEDLPLWADQVLVSIYQSFRSWQNGAGTEMLEEAVMGSEALREIMLEIQKRNNNNIL